MHSSKMKILTMLFVMVISYSLSSFSQDSNITYPIKDIEDMFISDSIEIAIPRDIRFKGDKAKFAVLKRSDGFFLNIKIKKSEKGGQAPNNQPRYEIAAYHFQQMFLDPPDYVVPPTIGRGFSLDMYRIIDSKVRPTFNKTNDVFCEIQYWLNNVTKEKVYDKKRLKTDSLYAYHFANLNIFTFLVRHSDSNEGNFLISKNPDNPRIFSVDNGIAFGDMESKRGYQFRRLLVKRVPQKTINRLRNISIEDLERELGVVAQFKIIDGHLVQMEPTGNLDKYKGVRISNEIIQFGLTEKEIGGIYNRLEDLLDYINRGKIKTF